MYALYHSQNGKIGYLLTFMAGLYFILPLLFSAIFEIDYIALFSIFGLLAQFNEIENPIQWLPIMGWNVIILVPLMILIARKYFHIADIRTEIETAVK